MGDRFIEPLLIVEKIPQDDKGKYAALPGNRPCDRLLRLRSYRVTKLQIAF